MTKSTLFVCEKPLAAKKFSALMNEGDNAILAQGTASYKFDYQPVNFSQSPYTKEEPLYKCCADTRHDFFNTGCWDFNGNKSENILLKNYLDLKNEKFFNKEKGLKILKEFFSQYEEIIYACDSDLTGYRGFDFKFEKYFNLGKEWIYFFEELDIKVTGMKYLATNEKHLKMAYQKREKIKNNPFYESLKSSYIKKDFFEYNYNLNSILFFNDALRNIGYVKTKESKVLTKNYILTLFLINNNQNLFEHTIFFEMEKRYIGSPISRVEIIKDLLKMNLIEENKFIHTVHISKKYYAYKLTEMGKKFIQNLHKKVDDPNLAIRLLQNNFISKLFLKKDERENASNLSIKDFKIKYEKYLYNTFSKQKRFLRKVKRDS